MSPKTPDRFPGEAEEEGLLLENLAPGNDPTVVGGVRMVNGEFRMKDTHGVFTVRDYGFRRHFLLMGA